MKANKVMIQGTGSDVGKTLLTAGLCRIFSRRGYDTAPFKSQNMALNSYITKNEKEIGRAQAMQAEAAGIEPEIAMNPILLKPNSDNNSQVVIEGKPYKNMTAEDYFSARQKMLPIIRKNLDYLLQEKEIVVIEGGGSPAEINLRDKDMVNMKIAQMAEAPVILVASIEKGGVFASIVGTLDLLTREERKRVKAVIINKFHGDISRFESGINFLEDYTGKPILGVLPYFKELDLPEEDSLDKRGNNKPSAPVNIAVVDLPHISNFTDFDYFREESVCNLRYTFNSYQLDKADLIIIPGSKNTISDLKKLYKEGIVSKIKKLADQGVMIAGICGGFQMLGKEIVNSDGIVISDKKIKGIGLLDINTFFKSEKITTRIKARSTGHIPFLDESNFILKGYEIHQGRTKRRTETEPAFVLRRKNQKKEIKDGAVSINGNIWGSYIHDLFANDRFRKKLLNYLLRKKGLKPLKFKIDNLSPQQKRLNQYDILADKLEKYLDMNLLDKIIFKNR
ncbi:MAG: cobyric acid synthase [Bacillota bacterium]